MVTRAVPAASESGRLRRGFLTSPAVNVMLFQASEENNEPTCATQNATNKPNTPAVAARVGRNDRSGCTFMTPCGLQRFEKLALMTWGLRPIKNPMRTSATRESVLAEVKTF